MRITGDELRKVQLIQLRILKELRRICVKHNIKYFLSDGTLIGAVRHHGFIPWDDDLDVGMLREEYERFCRVCKDELSVDYFLQNMDTDPGYAAPYAKLMLNGTEWIEHIHVKCEKRNGINIDIFPYDCIPFNRIKQIYHRRAFTVLNDALRIKKGYVCKIRVTAKKFLIVLILTHLFSYKLLSKLFNKTLVKYNYLSKTDNCIVTKFGGSYYRNQNPRKAFLNLTLVEFEDSLFYISNDFDDILKNLYGDYMTIPPEAERLYHDIVSYKLPDEK
ncbi:MAG: LicD family protein [Treponema sp.]|nr:LicD family protein [Treponema sp.]